MTNPTLFLIDTFSLLFQVFHAIPAMTSPKGLPSNAVFGFTRDLFNILQTQRPTHWLCAMDSPGPGTREALYPKYKANRTEMPEDLRPQIEMVQQVMDGFGIPKLRCDGWEADDVIATLTREAVERGWEVRIVTNDKDARQLLGPRVRIFNVRKNTWLDEADLKADWGVRPDQVIDYQSLVGDSVDNVPGVPLVGPKKATALLEQFGSLDAVLANADKVAGEKLKSNLKEFADLARLSRTLVTLNQHLELHPDWDAMCVGRVDVARLAALFNEFGFRRFIDEAKALPPELKLPTTDSPVLSVSDTPTEHPTRQWDVIETEAQLTAFAERLRSQREFCLDVISTALNPQQSEIVALAFAWEAHQSFVPVRPMASQSTTIVQPTSSARRQQSLFDDEEQESDVPDNSSQAKNLSNGSTTSVLQTLRPILESPDVQIVCHDLKSDCLRLRHAGIQVTVLGVDPMVASYLLEAGARGHDLAALAERFLHRTLPPFETALLEDSARLAEWATERADVAWQLARQLGDDLRREGLWDLYWNLERPLIGVLADMEANGIRVDVAELKRQSVELGRRLTDLIVEIHQLAGHEFNIDSPKQLAKIGRAHV